jgi:Astacin (Peptidase family M12A)/Ricin-type beta-trefoil lectin domain-like
MSRAIRTRLVMWRVPICLFVAGFLSGEPRPLFESHALAQTGPMEIAARHSNRCLDVAGGSRADQAVVQQFACHGGPNQLWRLEPAANNHYTIVSQNSGKCLDVPGASRQDGIFVQQFTCHGGANQLWRSESVGNNYYKIVSQNSGKCLDISDSSVADHAALQQFSCHGGLNQLWRLSQSGTGVRQANVLLPFNHDYRVVTYELRGGRMITEGDVELRPEWMINVTPGGEVQGGVGTRQQPAIARDRARWPGGLIPFEVASGFTQSTLQDIRNAIAHVNQTTNLRLVPREGHSDFVRFAPVASSANFCGTSCVGRVGGSQDIQIAPGCGMASAAHEIAHAAGLWHEQSRADRNRFVRVLKANVKSGSEHNFDQHLDDGVDLGPYDFRSLMHYGSTAFSIDGVSPTILPLNPATGLVDTSIKIGQAAGLSAGDIAALNLIYPVGSTTVANSCRYDPSALVQVDALIRSQATTAGAEWINDAIEQANDGDWDDAAYDLLDWWTDARRFDSAKALVTHFPYVFRESARQVNRVAPTLEMPEFQVSGATCALVPGVRQAIQDFLRFQARNDPGSIHSAVELAVAGEWDGAAEDLLNFWNDRDKVVEKLLLRHFPFALRTAAGLVGKLRNGQLFHNGRNIPLPDPLMVPVTP